MKKSIFLLLVPAIFSAQVKTELEVFNNSRGSVFDVANTNIKSYNGIDGKPYLNEAFLPITIDGYSKVLPNIRYNAYEDEMEFKNGDKLNYVVKAGEMRLNFTGLNKSYVLRNYQIDGKNVNGYLAELVKVGDATVGLYKREQIHIVENSNSTTNTYLKTANPRFEKSKDILLASIDNQFVRLPKNSKEVKHWIETYYPKANAAHTEDFAKKQKLNFSKEEDAKKFIIFLNSQNK